MIKRISFDKLIYIGCALAMLSLVILLLSVFSANIIPLRYSLIVLPIYTLIIISAVFCVIKSNVLPRSVFLICLPIVVFAVVLNLSLIILSQTASSLIESVAQRNVNYVEYSVIAIKGHGFSADNARRYGMIYTDKTFDDASAVIRVDPRVSIQAEDSIAGVFNSLINSDSVELVALRSASLGIVKDANAEIYNQVEVVRTFQVKTREQQVKLTDITKPYAIYISGIDTYGSIDSVSRSDVNIIAVINPVSRKVLLVNTPRDYYVQLHGTIGRKDKLTHAGVYGVDMSRTTMEDLYGINIPYYMRVNFSTLVKVIDTIGPINVYSPNKFKNYEVGYNVLDSKSALEFSRERYSFQDGDRQRGRNQQYVIEAIISKMSHLENAVKLPAIVSKLKEPIETNMPENSLKGVIRGQLDDTRSWTVKSISVDGGGAMLPTYSYGSTPLSVMVPDSQSVEAAKAEIADYLQ